MYIPWKPSGPWFLDIMVRNATIASIIQMLMNLLRLIVRNLHPKHFHAAGFHRF